MTKDRIFKGQSLISFPRNFCVIDIETTGLDSTFNEIIDISAIKVKEFEIIDTFSTLVKPEEPIDEFITNLTGITNEMVFNSPKINDVMPEFLKFIGNNILIGHNVNFDINFIYDNCLRNGTYLGNDFVDTMRISRRMHPELAHHRLKDLVHFYSLEQETAHRALADCQTTLECYLKLRNEFSQKYIDIPDFIKSTKRSCSKKVVESQNDLLNDLFEKLKLVKEDSLLQDKSVCFTGTLEHFTREEAIKIIEFLGASNSQGITKKTNYLVLGNNDYCSSIKNGKSNKQKKAEEYKLKGIDIEIISENTFYDMIFLK